MMTPLISIIIPTYNSDNYLKECLDSVITQTYDNLEVIIVDGGSTDATQSIVRMYCNDHINWSLIITSKGVAHQRNVGLKTFTGDYVYFLDSYYIFCQYYKLNYFYFSYFFYYFYNYH